MRSSTSNSEARFVAVFAATFLVLFGTWEGVLRARSGASPDFAIAAAPQAASKVGPSETWLVFGNCLMMTGVSTRELNDELGGADGRTVTNIAAHEQSPLAFFDYLRRSHDYPAVIITNVSSWINGTNFEQEAALVARRDPLRLRPPAALAEKAAAAAANGAYRQDDLGEGHAQRVAEQTLSSWIGSVSHAYGHRYHLFDYTLFLGTLATTGSLDDALYQLNMQSWFTVTGNETDGTGWVGLDVRYRADWPAGLDRMADRSLQRLRLSRLLTERYWTLLEEDVRDFQAHGTRVMLVRMPEHPRIREFNDETYAISERLRGLEERTGAPWLDLSHLGPAEGVRLFDGVHPDAPSAAVITRDIAAWVRAQHVAREGAAATRAGGG